jgi:hypothetical protein
LIKKNTNESPKGWHNILDQALWAYRTSPEESTKTTPFRLTFGNDVVLPAEICVQSTRVQRQHEIPVDHNWNMVLDELVDLDEERLKALDILMRQKERITKFYNKKVKSKTFDINDLVWKFILPMDKRNKALGKWAPGWEGPWKILRVFRIMHMKSKS